MRIQKVHLKEYRWFLTVFYDVTSYHVNEIIEELHRMDCPQEQVLQAIDVLDYNKGFTFTNPYIHETFVVICKTTSNEQFQNTFDHEKGYVAMHISEALGIEPFSEAFQYLAGKIGQKLYKYAIDYLCNCA